MGIIKIILFLISIGAASVMGYSAIKKSGFQIPSAPKATSTAQKIIRPATTSKPSISQTPSKSATPTPSYLPNITDVQIPKGFIREQLSPNFKEVKISSISYSASLSTPSNIRLNPSFQTKDKFVNISGWKIQTNRQSLIIPKIINVYDPSGLANETDILIGANNFLNIYSNSSAINKNLRLNKCIGYLENFNKFNPSLSQSCPPIYQNKTEIANFAGFCQTYIMSIGSCKLPDSNYYNNLPGTGEGNACREYLNNIGYANCFQKHRTDSDFLSNEFRAWVNQNIFDPKHDYVLLFDTNGLLVDEYFY